MDRKQLIALLILLAAGFLYLFIPDWWEDPRELAPGEWLDRANNLHLEIDATRILWRVGSHHGKIPYEWTRPDDEPYRARISFRGQAYEADITFNGPHEAIADLLVFDRLPEDAQRFIREKNQALNRPDKQIILRFTRVKED